MILQTSTRTVEPGITVVEMQGRLSLGNALRDAEDAIRKVASLPKSKTVIDISKVDYIDSAGLGMLISCNSSALKGEGIMHIAGATPRVQEVFEIARIHLVLSLKASVEEALAAF